MSILSRLFRRSPRNDDDRPHRLPSPDELVLLARPGGEAEAQLLRQLLAGAGIHSMVKNLDPVSAESGGIGPAWAYELWILRRDLRRGREVVGADDDPTS